MSAVAGSRPLLQATLRHDGRLMAPWVLLTTFLSVSSVLAYPWIFPDQAERAGLAAAVGSNPALGLIFGPAFDLLSTDGFNAWRSLALGGFLSAIGVIFAVTRATRAQEDSGQAELLASGVMGRSARLAAGVGVGLIASVLIGVVSGVATGLCGGGWNDSMLLAATFTATGWMFTGVAAVTAQLGSDARTANSLAVGTLGVLFIGRGVLYSLEAPTWALWLDPLAWLTETRPASGNHWWPLLPAVGLTALLLGVAFALQARRDFGQGVLAPRPGPARGRMGSPFALVRRINLTSLITWAVAFAALGTVFGYLATSVKDILGGDSAVQQILAAGATSPDALISAFLVTILSLMGIIASVPGVQVMLKLRAEELAERVEPVLATAVSRPRYFAATVVIAFLAPALYLVIGGTILAALVASADIGATFWPTFWQAIATIPAVWTVVAVAVAVVGARPIVSIAAWIGVLESFGITLLGPTFKLWDWVMAFSPFWHLPDVATGESGWGLLWISLVTLLLTAIGFAGFRRRDIGR